MADFLDHVSRTLAGTDCMRRPIYRRVVDGHNRIANIFIQHPPLLQNIIGQGVEDFIQQLNQRRWRKLFRQGGEITDIGKQYRDLFLFATQFHPVRILQDLLHQFLGDVGGQCASGFTGFNSQGNNLDQFTAQNRAQHSQQCIRIPGPPLKCFEKKGGKQIQTDKQ